MTPDRIAVVVGAGAAGLAAAIFARRRNPRLRVLLLDGARHPGAKILVSGGARCNVTNTVVSERDYNGGRPAVIRRILRAFPAPDTVTFFREIGVPLHEEPGGKLFPDSNRARDVLEALLAEATRTGVELRAGHRVLDLAKCGDSFLVKTTAGELTAQFVVLATGGLSLPKTGSDGWGYQAAQRLGHTLLPTTPALAPLMLDRGAERAIHAELSGVSQPVRLDLRSNGAKPTRVAGSLLWTHFGVSGPAALDMSRHWLRARLEGRDVTLTANLRPDADFESLERDWLDAARTNPLTSVQKRLADLLPASVATAVIEAHAISPRDTLARVSRDTRRVLLHALLEWPLPVRDSRGYNYAEVTAGGIPLTEIDPATMASRRCDGLYLVGEILDVDGRIGGFNFQWAWSTGHAAGEALARE